MTLAEELKSRNFSEFMNEVSSAKRASLTALLSRYIRAMVSATSPSPPVRVYWKKNPKSKRRMPAPGAPVAHLALESTAGAHGSRRLENLHVGPVLTEQWTASIGNSFIKTD